MKKTLIRYRYDGKEYVMLERQGITIGELNELILKRGHKVTFFDNSMKVEEVEVMDDTVQTYDEPKKDYPDIGEFWKGRVVSNIFEGQYMAKNVIKGERIYGHVVGLSRNMIGEPTVAVKWEKGVGDGNYFHVHPKFLTLH